MNTQASDSAKAIQTHRYVEAAKRHAQANASDPFAFRRAMTHIANGIVGMVPLDGREEALYNAEPYSEMRKLPAGTAFSNGETEFPVTTYRNIVRV